MDENQELRRFLLALTAKIEADKALLARSLGNGRLVWHRRKNGQIEFTLELHV
jgi:hypothetical protein